MHNDENSNVCVWHVVVRACVFSVGQKGKEDAPCVFIVYLWEHLGGSVKLLTLDLNLGLHVEVVSSSSALGFPPSVEPT